MTRAAGVRRTGEQWDSPNTSALGDYLAFRRLDRARVPHRSRPGWRRRRGMGSVGFASWPYDEICVIVEGRVAIEVQDGTRNEFGAGEAFLIAAGPNAVWRTL